MSLPREPRPYQEIFRRGILGWTTDNSRLLVGSWKKGRQPLGKLRRMEWFIAGREWDRGVEDLVGWVSHYSSGDRLIGFHDQEEPILVRASGEIIPLGAKIDLPARPPDRCEIREWQKLPGARHGNFVIVGTASGDAARLVMEARRPGKRPPTG